MADFDLGTARGHIEIDASGAEFGIGKATASSQQLDNTLRHASGGLTMLGGMAVGAGAAVVGGLAVALKSSSDFEASLSKIVGLVGVNREQVNSWRGDLLELAKVTGKAPTELADALFFITSAGLKGKDALDALDKSARASAAGLGETKVIADAVTSAMNAYGPATMSAGHATDVLIATVREGKMDAAALAGVIGNLTPVSAALGVSFDQVGAALAAMTRVGVDTATASTNLSAIFSAMLKPGTDAQNALKEVGLSAQGLRDELKSKGLLATLTTLQQKFGDNEAAMARVFPNVRGLRGMLAVMGQDAGTVSGIFDRLSNSTGSTGKAFDAVSKDNAFRMSQAMANLKTALIQIGVVVEPMAAQVLGAFGRMLKMFEDLSPHTQKIVVEVAAIAAGFLLVVGSMTIMVGLILRVITVFIELRKALTIVKEMQLVAKAMEALNASFLTNPIVLIIAALVALGVGLYELYKHSTGFREFVDALWQDTQKAWNFITNAFKVGVAFIKQHIDAFLLAMGPIGLIIVIWRHFGDQITSFAEAVVGKLRTVIDFIGNAFTQIHDLFKLFTSGLFSAEGFAQIMDNIFGGTGKLIGAFRVMGLTVATVWDYIQTTIRNAWAVIKGIWDIIVGVFTGDWGRVWNGITGIFGAVWNQITEIFSTAVNLITTGIGGFIIDTLKSFGGFVAHLIGSALNLQVQLLEAFGSWLATLPGKIADFITNVVTAFANFAVNLFTTSAQMGANMLTSFGQWLSELPNQIAYFIGWCIGSFIRLQIELAKAAVDIGVSVVEGIMSFIEALPGRLWGALLATINFMITFGSMALAWALSTGTSVVESLVSFFEALPGRMLALFLAVVGILVDFQAQAISWGIATGSSVVNTLVSFFEALPGRVWGFLVAVLTSAFNFQAQMITWAFNTGKGIVDNIISFVSSLPGKVMSAIGGLIGQLVGFAQQVHGYATDIGTSIVNGVVDFAKSLPGRIGDVITNLINIIKGAAGDAFNAMKGIGGSLWDGFKSGLHISSPSIIEKAMDNIVKNMASGVESVHSNVVRLQSMVPTMPAVDASLNVARSVGNLAAGTTSTVVQGNSTSVAGDVVTVNAHTDADAEDIAQEIAWKKRIRTRVAA